MSPDLVCMKNAIMLNLHAEDLQIACWALKASFCRRRLGVVRRTQELRSLRLLRLSATQAGRTGARAARSSGGWILHNGPLRRTLTRRGVPVLSQNTELPWGGLAQVRGRKGSACSDNAIEEVAKHSGDRAAVPPAHRGRRRCTSSHRKPGHSEGRWRPAPPPYPTLCAILQRRLASARRCSRRSVDGTAFGAGRSASCRA